MLVEGGATFDYTATPAFVKKYNCKEKISNNFAHEIEYLLYLLPKYDAPKKGNFVDDCIRTQELDYLIKKKTVVKTDKKRTKKSYGTVNLKLSNGKSIPAKAEIIEDIRREHGSLQELLYYAILFNDLPIIDCLNEKKVTTISKIRADIIRGKDNKEYDRGEMPYYQDEFIREFKRIDNISNLQTKLTNVLTAIKAESIDFPPRFFKRDEKGVLDDRFCDETVFEGYLKCSIIIKAVGEMDLYTGLIKKGNIAGIQALEKECGGISRKNIDKLLEYSSKTGNTEMSAWLMEYKNNHF